MVKLLNAWKITFNFERLSAMGYQNKLISFVFQLLLFFLLLFEKDKNDDTIILNLDL